MNKVDPIHAFMYCSDGMYPILSYRYDSWIGLKVRKLLRLGTQFNLMEQTIKETHIKITICVVYNLDKRRKIYLSKAEPRDWKRKSGAGRMEIQMTEQK